MSDIYSYLQMCMDNRTKNLESDHLCIYYYHMDEMLGLESDVAYVVGGCFYRISLDVLKVTAPIVYPLTLVHGIPHTKLGI